MKLAIVISGLGMGGAESMLLKILTYMDRKQFSPHVISLTSTGVMGPRIMALGVPVHAMEMASRRPDPTALWRLAKMLRRLAPDAVHTMMYHANLVGGLATRWAGVSALSWGLHHSDLSGDTNKRSTLAVVRVGALLSGWLPNLILSCSDVAKDVHVRHGYAAGKMVVLPNGFDISSFRPDRGARLRVRQELGMPADTPLVGLIGRFDPQKNHSGFFEAAGLLHRRRPATRFVLAGAAVDPSNPVLMRHIDAQGLGHVTHLLGPRNDVPALMASLDVLASSSHGEAFPNVLGEAMSCGVPCAVTEVGDSAYIVGDTGRTVPRGDMAGLAAAMDSLLAMPSHARAALSVRARARVEQNFEIGKVVKQYEAFYLRSYMLGKNQPDRR